MAYKAEQQKKGVLMPGRLSLYVFVLGKGASRAVTLLKVMPGQLQAVVRYQDLGFGVLDGQ